MIKQISKENKRYLILGFLYLLLSAGLIFSIFKFGVTAAVKLSEFIQGNPPDSSNNTADIIIPAPQLSSLLEATNSAELNLWGFAPANQKVEIYLNGSIDKTVEVNSEGKFESEVTLLLGSNTIYANTRNKDNIISQSSRAWTVFYSDTPPSLEMLDPKDEKVTVKTKIFQIKGRVDKSSKVLINEHMVITNPEGEFIYPVNLVPGENIFKIIILNPSQNKTEKEITFLVQ